MLQCNKKALHLLQHDKTYICTSVRNLLRVGTWQLQHVFISSSAQGRQSFAHVSSLTPAMFHKITSTTARTTTSVRKIRIAITRMLANSDIFTAISWTYDERIADLTYPFWQNRKHDRPCCVDRQSFVPLLVATETSPFI